MKAIKKESWWHTVGLILAGLVFALIFVEILVRIFFHEPILPRFIIDSGYGIRVNQPNIHTQHIMPGEYEVTITTNADGLRGRQREYDKEKPQGVYRIALIGDSFVFGYGVNDHEVVSAVLEKELNTAGSRKFEVLNFGVSGFGQAEELILFLNFAKLYQPDEVILFYSNNDMGNNSVSNLFEVNDAGKLQITEQAYLPGVRIREILYASAPFRWLFTHSQAWNLVRNRLSYLVQKTLLQKKGLQSFSDEEPKAVNLTRVLLNEFIRKIQKSGAIARVLIIPAKKKDGNLTTNFPMNVNEVRQLGASVLNGNEFLQVTDYYERDSHWNAKGHEKAGKALSRIIRQ